jgi:hypothetical protein
LEPRPRNQAAKREGAQSPRVFDYFDASNRQPKQLVDNLQLREWLTFGHPSGSPLPNHADCLDSL